MEISAEKTKLMKNNEIEIKVLKLKAITSSSYLCSVITVEGWKPEIFSTIAQETAALLRCKPGVFFIVPRYDWSTPFSHPSSCTSLGMRCTYLMVWGLVVWLVHNSRIGCCRLETWFQIGFSLVNAAVACAILESISGLELSSVITEPRYLKLVTVSVCEPSVKLFFVGKWT